jgi:DNA (cytosine-5)-methyltransferase 1
MFRGSGQCIAAVDLFCGAGGLTVGLESTGIAVKLAVDIDPACAHPIEANSRATFLEADISSMDLSVVRRAFSGGRFSLLAGCAPCQPFSTYARSSKQRKQSADTRNGREDWKLVERFGDIVQAVSPDLVTMENVPPLSVQPVFHRLIRTLRDYWIDWRYVECDTIGLPQTRRRLVLVASRLGPISIPHFDKPRATVRTAIGDLPKLKAGEHHCEDLLHRSSRLSSVNLERIRNSVPGGTWRDWPEHLRAACHSKRTGETYPSVYGRMEWDVPAPTITTQCFGYGNGRFGHPEQDRAISLREAAVLQGFPRDYSFVSECESVRFATIGRLIGNAVPVLLGAAIGEVFVQHVGAIRGCNARSRCG